SDDVTVYRSDNIKIKVEKSSPKKQDLPKKQGDQSKSAVTQSKVNLDSARTYKAKRGDTLSAILRSRGVKGKDKNRFIVALYESNKDSFIESNLHGLLQGASLNFESVEANAAKITDQEATLIVDQHWGQWRQWRLSLVSDNLASLNAPIKNIKSKQPSKPLTEIAKQEGEIAKNNRYVIHVASFKNHEQSKQLVKVLRSKGFNAYETTADIAGKGLFQRVLIDRFSDRGEAIEYASKIKYEGTLSYARVLELPYAIKVGLHVPSAAGELLLEELNRAGANGAHMLKYDNNDNVITLFGAYTTKKEADVVAADLSAKGYHSAVVMP
ncbi:MAG: SPOR domain-containing protein, partial [Nitrospinota bacterium]